MKIGISQKILGSFIFIIILSSVSTGMAYYVMKDLTVTINKVRALSRWADLSGDLQLQLNKLLVPVNEYLIEGDPVERDHYDRSITKLSEILEDLKQYKGDAAWQSVVKNVRSNSVILGSMAVELLYMDNPVGNKKASTLLKKINIFSEHLLEDVSRFHDITVKDMKDMESRAMKKEKRANIIFAVAMTISILSLPLFFLYMSRYVTRPILNLHEGANMIREGRLDHRISVKTGDEIEALAEGFNNMAASLEDAKKELDRRLLELYTLYNVSKILNTSFETEQLLVRLVSDISKNLNIHRVMIMLLDERRQELYSASFTDFEKEGLREVRRKVGEGFYGLVAQTGMARLIRDVDTEINLPKEDILSPDIRSIIAVPFGRREKTLGIICAFKDRPDTFEWHDLELFRAVAEHVAVAIENARLFMETKLQAITDGLTGLYNHRFFRGQLELELERSERYNRSLSLIILDIDKFKHYNDTHGHPTGDELLRELADLLRKGIRDSDVACRYGGEEFALILPETAKDAALALAERIRKTIADHPFPFRETQPMGAVTASFGVSSYPVDEKEIDKFIKKADDALYRAKNTGRNRVQAA